MKRTDEASYQIREFILNHFPLARQRSIMDADPLLDSGIIDSLGVLDLVDFLEKEFDIAVSEEDLVPENFQSISCLAEFVQARLNGASAPRSKE